MYFVVYILPWFFNWRTMCHAIYFICIFLCFRNTHTLRNITQSCFGVKFYLYIFFFHYPILELLRYNFLWIALSWVLDLKPWALWTYLETFFKYYFFTIPGPRFFRYRKDRFLNFPLNLCLKKVLKVLGLKKTSKFDLFKKYQNQNSFLNIFQKSRNIFYDI